MLGMNIGLFRKLAVDDRVWTASELAKDPMVDLRLLGKHLSSKLQTFKGTNITFTCIIERILRYLAANGIIEETTVGQFRAKRTTMMLADERSEAFVLYA